jgi:phosphoribosylglycinamide formyltransferase 1
MAATSQKHIAVFASGGGSNARKIMAHFINNPVAKVALVVSNKPDAGVLHIAGEFGVPTLIIQRKAFYETTAILDELRAYEIDFIALAGFLWLVPAYLVEAFPEKIVNIHPALLPKYGGKGMYGMHVHTAVKAAGEQESGITIHYVNTRYDEGDYIFQAKAALEPSDTPETIAAKVLALEHRHFPEVIEQMLRADE